MRVTIARLEISVIGLSEVWNLCCEVNPALCSYWVIKIQKVLPDSGNFQITLFTEYFIHKVKQNSEKLFWSKQTGNCQPSLTLVECPDFSTQHLQDGFNFSSDLISKPSVSDPDGRHQSVHWGTQPTQIQQLWTQYLYWNSGLAKPGLHFIILSFVTTSYWVLVKSTELGKGWFNSPLHKS